MTTVVAWVVLSGLAPQSALSEFQKGQFDSLTLVRAKTLVKSRTKTCDDRLAQAFFRSKIVGNSQEFVHLVRSTSANDYREKTREAIPAAIEYYNGHKDIQPAIAAMRWTWDGASGELMGPAWMHAALSQRTPFAVAVSKQTRRTRREVYSAISLDTNKTSIRSLLKSARSEPEKALWQGVLKALE